MLMAGDFATAFLMKNIIALVSVGDPKNEPDYSPPDQTELLKLQMTFQNPQQAMWAFVDPTVQIRFATPDKDALDNAKYNEYKEALKNLLPSPFWYHDSGSSFADATVEMQALEEEATACQNDFNDQFWLPIHERAAQGRPRIASKNIKPPKYDRSALIDRVSDLKSKSELYANGGLSVDSLMRANGIDPEVERAKLIAEKADVKKGIYMPAFEQKQGIVAAKTYAIGKAKNTKNGDGGPGGRPEVDGAKPQAESTTPRTPRPSERSR
jgi:hypothetical protein